MKEIKSLYVAIAVVVIFVLAGFFLIFNSIGSLRNDLKNLELTVALRTQNQTTTTTEENTSENQDIPKIIIEKDQRQETGKATTTPKDDGTAIPTAIVFENDSSPILLPQTKITIVVDNVVRYSDESIAINFKAFTDKASGYSAIDPKEIFQLVRIGEETDVWQKPIETKGKFDSIPQKSVSSGAVLFRGFPGKNTIILQTGTGNATRFFEFNFSTKTYKEVVLG